MFRKRSPTSSLTSFHPFMSPCIHAPIHHSIQPCDIQCRNIVITIRSRPQQNRAKTSHHAVNLTFHPIPHETYKNLIILDNHLHGTRPFATLPGKKHVKLLPGRCSFAYYFGGLKFCSSRFRGCFWVGIFRQQEYRMHNQAENEAQSSSPK